jgi:hypothetical protein
MGATSKWLFILGFLNGSPEIPTYGTLATLTSCANLRSRWHLKKSYSPRRELSNGMSHVACTQGNRVDSWLLMVGSQIVNLTPDLSFGHNLCFKCSNEQCDPILGIYTSIAFQWYKKFLKAMGFDPCNCALKIQESFWDSNSQHRSSFGSVRIHALTLFAFPRACEVTPGSPSWPVTLQPPCFGRKPKARVVTQMVNWEIVPIN